MQIVLNGKCAQILAGLGLLELLNSQAINPEIVAVELNNQVVEKNNYANVILKEGDRLEIVKFMGGGKL